MIHCQGPSQGLEGFHESKCFEAWNCWEIGLPILLIKKMKAGFERKRKYVQLFNFACSLCFGLKRDSILDPFTGRRIQPVPTGGIFFFLFYFYFFFSIPWGSRGWDYPVFLSPLHRPYHPLGLISIGLAYPPQMPAVLEKPGSWSQSG